MILTGTNKCGWINQKYLQVKNTSQAQTSNSMGTMLTDGEYSCIIDWTLNARLADYYLSFRTGGTTYTYPMDSQIMITVYGFGQDGYHEIEYTCEELDRDRYGNHYDFMPGNSSEANITIKNGTITSLSIRYAE